MIFYSDTREPMSGAPSVPYEKWNANKAWAQHTYNVRVLKFMQGATRDAAEKIGITREIEIGTRKISWWERHPNFTLRGALAEFERTFGTKMP